MINEKNLIRDFHNGLQLFFEKTFDSNRFLYFSQLPLSFWKNPLTVHCINSRYEWIGEPILTYTKHLEEDNNYEKLVCQFEQKCKVSYSLQIGRITAGEPQINEVHFVGHSFEPYGFRIYPNIKRKDVEDYDNLRAYRVQLKKQHAIENLREKIYGPEQVICFSFFTDVTRKKRIATTTKNEVGHGYFYHEFESCHIEIEFCLLHIIFHSQYLNDLMGRKEIMENGEAFYYPNLQYHDFQYLTWVGFAFDRLYSFWDRLAYLLFNFYVPSGIKEHNNSFEKYMKAVIAAVANPDKYKAFPFNIDSTSLSWLIEFYQNKYELITAYRHRSVHYKFTEDWQGILTASFMNNVLEHTTDANKLTRIKKVFDGLVSEVYEHFNLASEGFKNILLLIDELPVSFNEQVEGEN
jgi:hypothetical protein